MPYGCLDCGGVVIAFQLYMRALIMDLYNTDFQYLTASDIRKNIADSMNEERFKESLRSSCDSRYRRF